MDNYSLKVQDIMRTLDTYIGSVEPSRVTQPPVEIPSNLYHFKCRKLPKFSCERQDNPSFQNY